MPIGDAQTSEDTGVAGRALHGDRHAVEVSQHRRALDAELRHRRRQMIGGAGQGERPQAVAAAVAGQRRRRRAAVPGQRAGQRHQVVGAPSRPWSRTTAGPAGLEQLDCAPLDDDCTVVHDAERYREESIRNWGSVAPAWERSRPVTQETDRELDAWLLDRLAISPGQTILEVAAGQGDTGLQLRPG